MKFVLNLSLVVFILAASLVAAFPQHVVGAAPIWWNSDYQYRKIIRISDGVQDYRFQIVNNYQYEYAITAITIDHQNYGLGYPVTYIFALPNGSTNLTAYKRTLDAWGVVTEKHAGDIFNGIEAVRYDYQNNKAYISVSFSSVSDTIHLKMTDSLGQEIPLSFIATAKYYDNRKAAVVFTADDYGGETASFSAAINYSRANNIWITPGIIVRFMDASDWTNFQAQVNQGFVEPASHSLNHAVVDNYTAETAGSYADITGNLTMPSIMRSGPNQYVWAWLEPGGYSDSSSRHALGNARYLIDRSSLLGTVRYQSWDAGNSLYDRIGVTEWMDPTVFGGSTDLGALNRAFDATYNAGNIYSLATHPENVDWTVGGNVTQHLNYIGNRTDVWYVGQGSLYQYRYLSESNLFSSNLLNFPVKIHLTHANFDFTKVKPDLSDIRFVDKTNTTVLNTENASWDSAMGDAVFWVSANISLHNGYDELFYLYYGNPSATPLWDMSAAWRSTGAAGIWHLGTTANNGTSINDSSGFGNTLAVNNAPVWTLGNGRTFDNTANQSLRVNDTGASSLDVAANFTVIWQMSVNSSSPGDSNAGVIAKDRNDASNWKIYLISNTVVGFVNTYSGKLSSWNKSANGSHTWALKITSDNVSTTYENGSNVGALDMGVATGVNDHNFYIGTAINTGDLTLRYFKGTISEVQVYSISESDDFVKAMQMNLSGALVQFGDTNSPPSLITLPVSNALMNKEGITSGDFSGIISSLGGTPTADYWVEYGLTPAYGSSTSKITTNSIGLKNIATSGNLTPGQTYHCRFAGANEYGGTYGSDSAFTLTMPSVATNPVTDYTLANSAILNGVVSEMGVASDAYVSFEYGWAGYAYQTAEESINATGAFSRQITNFGRNSVLHARAMVRIGAIYSYGQDVVLQTTPTITTDGATNITSNSAQLNGTLTGLGTSTSANVSFSWGLAAGNYTGNIPVVTMNTTGIFTANLTGLSANATYYFRAEAVGDGTNYGGDTSFTTSSAPGDANGDGVVNALDITETERIVAHMHGVTTGADVNQDGIVNALDITSIERIIAGLR